MFITVNRLANSDDAAIGNDYARLESEDEQDEDFDDSDCASGRLSPEPE